MRKGFTLIETLVVAAITIAIAVAGFLGLAGFRNKQALEAGLDEFRAAVEGTKRRSVVQEQGSRWGMRFTNATSGVSSYVVFKGSSYSTSGVDRLYSFREPVGFANPSASSTYDAVFAPLSGALSENKVITLIGGSDGLIGDLIFRTIGSITARNDNNMAGYWHLDEGAGTAAYDASGYGNTGTLTNSPTWTSGASCKAGSCLLLNGTTNYVSIPSVGLTSVSSFTIEGWTYLTDGSVSNNPLYAGAGHVRLLPRPAGYYFGVTLGGVEYFSQGSTASNLNSWVHWALVRSGSTMTFYRNGSNFYSSSTIPTTNADISGNIGTQVGSYYLKGYTDEVRIYSRALTADEILAHYNDLK